MALWEYVWSWSAVTVWLYRLNWNADDSSWNWTNWTASNITRSSGVLSSAGDFNGSTSNITNLWSPNLWTWSYTYSFFMKTPWKTWIDDSNFILDYVVVNGNVNRFSIRVYPADYSWSLIAFARWASWQNVYRITNFVFNDDKWHHVVVTINISWVAINLYVDWVLDQWSQTGVTLSAIDTTWLRVWSDYAASWWFDWLLDELIIENRIWTATEVQRYYTYAKWRFVL